MKEPGNLVGGLRKDRSYEGQYRIRCEQYRVCVSLLKVGVGQHLTSVIDLAGDGDYPTVGSCIQQPVHITWFTPHTDPAVCDRRRVVDDVAVCIVNGLRG